MEEYIGYIVFGCVIFAIVTMAARELFCWYFKINKVVGLMIEQNKILWKIFDELSEISEDRVIIEKVKDDLLDGGIMPC